VGGPELLDGPREALRDLALFSKPQGFLSTSLSSFLAFLRLLQLFFGALSGLAQLLFGVLPNQLEVLRCGVEPAETD
jgi:hypothetical protein